MKSKGQMLFTRFNGGSLILTADDLKYPADRIFNPAAVQLPDGRTVLLARIADFCNFSHLGKVTSRDGKRNWTTCNEPTLEADPNHGEDTGGLEDPRVVWVEELQEFIIVCTSFRAKYLAGSSPIGMSLLGTKDFSSFRRISKPLGTGDKNGSLVEERIGGRLALMHRPSGERSHIAVSFSDDLQTWGDTKSVFSTRQWGWDTYGIGMGPPLIKTKEGWLLIYHGSWGLAHTLVYRVGLALLDEKLNLKRRSSEWVLGPENSHDERIVFPTGAIVDGKTRELRLYFGSGDRGICLATANMDEVIEYVMGCPDK